MNCRSTHSATITERVYILFLAGQKLIKRPRGLNSLFKDRLGNTDQISTCSTCQRTCQIRLEPEHCNACKSTKKENLTELACDLVTIDVADRVPSVGRTDKIA
ncbi:hypothetical protein BKA67DRAFT_26163 [Truncatella angustata]|uniref:Uncharacterized protein n=1 Tax=Truncatella angustata TaxID=152316 RepID=A0A9P8UWA6_9PEZI|nr:uncharacterized protein BKA67DRAFT_26163 [Truncatella angustata]KAH6659726.1 hypothetical protein BKA67DRAFT_26163 [Truncatella angustata]